MMKMGALKTATLFFIMAISLFFIIGCSANNEINPANGALQAPEQNFQTIATGSTQTGDVLIELTLISMPDGKLQFEMAANTHSVDLSQYNLMELTTLEYNGNAIKPVSAPQLSGHHTSGDVIFNAGSDLKNFKVVIKGIPNVDERAFEWK